jgi:hypothetical protein
LPPQFHQKYYDFIEVFQRERVVNIPLHTKDVNVEGDGIYKSPT